MAINFNFQVYKWALTQLKNQTLINLRTIVTDDTSQLWGLTKDSGPELLNLAQILCLWHAQQKIRDSDDNFNRLVYEISHSFNQELVTYLIEQLMADQSTKNKKWINKIFVDQKNTH